MFRLLSLFFLVFSIKPVLNAQDSWADLAKTPPMGWNSWNTFRLGINEDVVKAVADDFVEKGFKEAGTNML